MSVKACLQQLTCCAIMQARGVQHESLALGFIQRLLVSVAFVILIGGFGIVYGHLFGPYLKSLAMLPSCS